MPDRDPRESTTALRRLRHDMRTPLGQILGYSEMLQEECEERDQRELLPDLERIQQAARGLLELVDERLSGEEKPKPSAEETAETAAPEAARTPAEGAGARLLVVDDEPGNRDMLSRRLTARGYDVETAEGGREALHRIWQGGFDLVLLDWMMPGMSGLEVLESIRSSDTDPDLPVIMVTALSESADVVRALGGGANDYVTKPVDVAVLVARVEKEVALRRAAEEQKRLAGDLAIRNTFIRKILGRYVSEEVAGGLLETASALDLSGARRRVTILMSDIRGFTPLIESLAPEQVVAILNNHLGRMDAIVREHGGTVDAFIGDAVLAFFGAPKAHGDDAERAVACAIAMQRAMEDVNSNNRERGLPEIGMGIGLATGDAIVGNIGSEERANYTAIGSTVNLASRVESYTLGGQVLLAPSTLAEVASLVEIEDERDVHPKGFEEPLRITEVRGIRGRYAASIPEASADFRQLEKAAPLRFSPLDGKHIEAVEHTGTLTELASHGAVIRSDAPVEEMGDLRVQFLDERGEPLPGPCYAKVVELGPGDGAFTVRFTVRSPALDHLGRGR